MRFYLYLLVFLSCISLWGQNDSIRYSFFVAGHTYGKPGANNVGFHPEFMKQFPYIQGRTEIRFGVLTGDIVSANPTAQDWDEIDSDIETLGLPTYFAVGNHDMEDRDLYESRYGDTYYEFEYGDDLFIVLDPNLDEWNISGDQLAFLKDVLNAKAPTVENIFVFFHQILWKGEEPGFDYISWNSESGRASSINFWSEVEPLFHTLPNQVVMFAGDLGASWASAVTYDSFDNITLIATGMGHEDGENFVVVNVQEDNTISYDLICLSDPDINCLGELTDYLRVSEVMHAHGSSTLLYPNPASDQFIISTGNKEAYTIQLFDLRGALIMSVEISDQYEYSIDASQLKSGFYIVRIFGDDLETTSKIIVE